MVLANKKYLLSSEQSTLSTCISRRRAYVLFEPAFSYAFALHPPRLLVYVTLACCRMRNKGEKLAAETHRGPPGGQVPRDGGEEEERREARGQPQRGLVPDGVLPHVPPGAHAPPDVDIAGNFLRGFRACTAGHYDFSLEL